jgi:hypothetical protein
MPTAGKQRWRERSQIRRSVVHRTGRVVVHARSRKRSRAGNLARVASAGDGSARWSRSAVTCSLEARALVGGMRQDCQRAGC